MTTQFYHGTVTTILTSGPQQVYTGKFIQKLHIPIEGESKVLQFKVRPENDAIVLSRKATVEDNELVVSFVTNKPSRVNYGLKVSPPFEDLSNDPSNFFITEAKNGEMKVLDTFKSEFVFHKNIYVQYNSNGSSFRGRVLCFIYPDIFDPVEYETNTKALVYLYHHVGQQPSTYYAEMQLVDNFYFIDSNLGGKGELKGNPIKMIYKTVFHHNEVHWLYDVGNLNLKGVDRSDNSAEIEITKLIVPSNINKVRLNSPIPIYAVGYNKNKENQIKIYRSASVKV